MIRLSFFGVPVTFQGSTRWKETVRGVIVVDQPEKVGPYQLQYK